MKKKKEYIKLTGWMDIREDYSDWRDETDITQHKSKFFGGREVTITIEEH